MTIIQKQGGEIRPADLPYYLQKEVAITVRTAYVTSVRQCLKPGCAMQCSPAVFFSTCHRQILLFYRSVPFYIPLIAACSAQGYFPSELVFSCAKVLPWKNIQVPLSLFERNFPVAFPIFNRSYFAEAPYRYYKISSKFLACFFLKGNL